MDQAPQVQLHRTSHYFLESLNEIGVVTGRGQAIHLQGNGETVFFDC